MDDPDWIPPKTPFTPKTRGYRIEAIVLENMYTTCCGVKITPSRKNQMKIDGRCSNCNKGIQIKTTNQTCGMKRVAVTKASGLSTCQGSPVSIYKFYVSEGGVCKKKSRIFSPNHSTKSATYYSHVTDNPWGQPILEPTNETTVKIMPDDIVSVINKKLFF
jgi:hypothetical protein